ncbi:MAG: methyltransferase domain-containing protein [Candidatus Xenobia bacterium]
MYDFEFSPETHPGHCWLFVLDMVGNNRRVLDVGCAVGNLSKLFKERGNRVTGIEQDAEAAARAQAHCERVLVGDLESMSFSELPPASFDAIVCADVLEHLRDPAAFLARVRPLLKEDGFVVASVPNIAHISVRLQLLEGRFDYTQYGILDRTHLRFYHRSSLIALFEQAGYVVVQTERTVNQDYALHLLSGELREELLQWLRQDNEIFTYQFVMKAISSAAASQLVSLRRQVDELEEENRKLKALVQAADSTPKRKRFGIG